MKEHGDQGTPLWVTELGWGSAPPDRFGLNKGLEGQEQLLADSFKLILRHRKDWNVQRVFWFDWRDPANPERGQMQLLRQRGAAEEQPHPEARLPGFQALRRTPAEALSRRASLRRWSTLP